MKNKSQKNLGAKKMCPIQTSLSLIESDEMREHTRKWLLNHDADGICNICTNIVFNAPITLEQKFEIMDAFDADPGFNSDATEINMYFFEIDDVLAQTRNNTQNHTFYLFMYDRPKEEPLVCKNFGEAVEYLKETRKNKPIVSFNDCHKHGKINIIQNFLQPDSFTDFSMYWFIDDNGKILYYDWPSKPIEEKIFAIPGKTHYSIPFQPGDIVNVDLTPFAEPKKVLILTNDDSAESKVSTDTTCLFLSDLGNIEVCFLKDNGFLKYPEHPLTTALYRLKKCDASDESEMPLAVLSHHIKKNPVLGDKIGRYARGMREKYKFDKTLDPKLPPLKELYEVTLERLIKEFELDDGQNKSPREKQKNTGVNTDRTKKVLEEKRKMKQNEDKPSKNDEVPNESSNTVAE